MNTRLKQFALLLSILFITSCQAPGGGTGSLVLVKTTLGDIKIKLYDNTPVHRDNFIKLVKMGYYDGISFHRVIRDFMIQAGDPATRTGLTAEQLDTLITYTLPAEFRPEYFHKKGALAAAREGNSLNPEMRSSGTQFYIVQGTKYTDQDLASTEKQINNNIKQSYFNKFMFEIADSALKAGVQLPESEIQEKASIKMFDYLSSSSEFRFTEEQKNNYKTTGGVARLDGTYTVFGEVVEGLDIVDKIASVQTNKSDTPLSDIRILKMKLLSR